MEHKGIENYPFNRIKLIIVLDLVKVDEAKLAHLHDK